MKHKSKIAWLGLLLTAPLVTFAQQTANSGSSYFSNALFNTLLVIVVMLLVLVLALSSSIKNIIQSDYFKDKYKKEKGDSTGTKAMGALLAFVMLSGTLEAQNASPVVTQNDWLIGGLDYFTFYFMVTIILIEVIVVILLLNILKGYTRSDIPAATTSQVADGIVKKEKTMMDSLMDKLNDAVEIEKEEEIMLDHDYDGIKELDNNLPPWWKYGFYLTILVSVVYLVNYHITGTGDLQTVEYNKEIAQAKIDVEEFMKNSANNVDETTVKYLSDAASLDAGKQIFEASCVTCHGKMGEGNAVGPNLTDQYWLHSGGIVDIFKTIKYGWPDKGMKSWKDDFSPVQIAQLSSYIKSLQGSNPPNPKAAQGDLYTEAPAMVDSTVVPVDSNKVSVAVAAIDTLNKK